MFGLAGFTNGTAALTLLLYVLWLYEQKYSATEWHITVWSGTQIFVPLITWTCVLEAHKRCHPRGGDTDPALASFGPGSVLWRKRKMDGHTWTQCPRVYTMAIKMQDLFTNKAHASPEDKDAVQCSNFHKLISFISVEGQQHSFTFVLIELMPLKGRKQV